MKITYIPDSPPVSEKVVDDLFSYFGAMIPKDLRKLWSLGAGGFVNDFIKIYSASEIEERNQTFEIFIYFPDFLAIGDDSGGALILTKKNGSGTYVVMDSGSPNLEGQKIFKNINDVFSFILEGQHNSEKNDSCLLVSIGMPISSKIAISVKKKFRLKETSLQIKKNTLIKGSFFEIPLPVEVAKGILEEFSEYFELR